MFSKIRAIKLKTAWRNFKLFLSEDISEIKNKSDKAWVDLLRFRIVALNDDVCGLFSEEIEFVRKNGICSIPYESDNDDLCVETGYDKKKCLPYVIHKNKRLYFPSTFSEHLAKLSYTKYIKKERLLGLSMKEKAPHQYQSEKVKVEQNDVVFDLGAAEGLFALDIIDMAKKVYIFECDPIWNKPLKATFSPYKSKVELVPKFVSNRDSGKMVSLNKFLCKNANESIFIKADIEGSEIDVVNDISGFLSNSKNTKVSFCTYHRAEDADVLKEILNRLNYSTEFSNGYMIFMYDLEQVYPYFRHGVIRAGKASGMWT